MYINYINDRKSLGFMCLKDIEAGDQVTVVLETGIICIAISISINSSLFMNDKDLVDRSYSDRRSHERVISSISNQELNTLEDSHNSGITIQTGNGTILRFQQKAHDSSFNEQFHLLEEDNSQVILVKAGDSQTPTPPTRGSGPSNFPVAPPSGGRPTRPVPWVNPYRTSPKVVDQKLDAAANPAGAGNGGGNAEFDDNNPSSKKEQSQESKTFNYDYYPKEKKQSSEQCKFEDNLNDMPEFRSILEGSVVPVESLLGTSSGFKAQYKNLKKDSIAHKQAVSSIRKLAEGSLKIGDKNVRKIKGMKKIYEAKTKYVRVYFQMKGDTVQIILPALKTDQKQSIKLLKKYFK